MTAHRFLEPLDVLFLRGNRLFGDPGSYGEALVPPWPSVAAGAIRSQMLAADGVDFGEFAAGRVEHPQLGTPERPGSFAITGFHLAIRDGKTVETLHPLPADLIVTREGNHLRTHRLSPRTMAPGIASSALLPRVPVLAADTRAKPIAGCWLTAGGWRQYLAGEPPTAGHLLESKELWKLDPRVGVGLDSARRRADDGKLFTVQAVALAKNHGFLATIEGAEPPLGGTLRLGGDGRAAAVNTLDHQPPEPDYEAIATAGRCRIVLTTPGIFPGGWRPIGVDVDHGFALHGVADRLVCAAVSRAEVVSGWDLAHWRPKPAQRVAPIGSVYWLDDLETTGDQLRKLAAHGLWPEQGYDASRRAEGFNRFTFATY